MIIEQLHTFQSHIHDLKIAHMRWLIGSARIWKEVGAEVALDPDETNWRFVPRCTLPLSICSNDISLTSEKYEKLN